QKVKKGGYDSLVMSVCCMLILAIVGWNMAFVVAEEEEEKGICDSDLKPGWCGIIEKLKDGKMGISSSQLNVLKLAIKSEINTGSEDLISSSLLSELSGGKSFNLNGILASDIDNLKIEDTAEFGKVLSLKVRNKKMFINHNTNTLPEGVTGIEVNAEQGVRYVFKNGDKQSVIRVNSPGVYPVKDDDGNIILKGFSSGSNIEDIKVNLGEHEGDGHVVIDGIEFEVKGKAVVSIGDRKIESLDTTVTDTSKSAKVDVFKDGILAKQGVKISEGDLGFYEFEGSDDSEGLFVGDLANENHGQRSLNFVDGELQGDLSGFSEGESVVFTKTGKDDLKVNVGSVMNDDTIDLKGKNKIKLIAKKDGIIEGHTSAVDISSVSKLKSSGDDSTTMKVVTGTPPTLPIQPGETDPNADPEDSKDPVDPNNNNNNNNNGNNGGSGGGGSGGGGLAGLLSNPLLLMGLLGAGLLAFLAFGGDDDEPPAQDVGCKIDPDTGNAEEGQDPEACGAEYNGEGDDEPGVNGDSTESDVATGASPEQEAAAQCACSPEGCDCSAVLDEPSVQGSTNTGADAGTTTGTATDDATVDE
ncbi:MAG: hypothetical protein ACI83O_000909, partial [Patescibacteria group bacterium]